MPFFRKDHFSESCFFKLIAGTKNKNFIPAKKFRFGLNNKRVALPRFLEIFLRRKHAKSLIIHICGHIFWVPPNDFSTCLWEMLFSSDYHVIWKLQYWAGYGFGGNPKIWNYVAKFQQVFHYGHTVEKVFSLMLRSNIQQGCRQVKNWGMAEKWHEFVTNVIHVQMHHIGSMSVFNPEGSLWKGVRLTVCRFYA
jgi:hypothetical protein